MVGQTVVSRVALKVIHWADTLDKSKVASLVEKMESSKVEC